MHRDLKPQNLLVDDAIDCLKIADLGLGRAFSVPIKSYTHEARTHALMTLHSCCPAVFACKGTTCQVMHMHKRHVLHMRTCHHA